MIDLHNLHIENRVDLVANPLNEKREHEVESLKSMNCILQKEIDAKPVVNDNEDLIDDLVAGIGSKLTLEDSEKDDAF